ncbi:EAL domain-containing protein [Temperatibacter marinus]|uniref:EAL domain-containing protein n=1 Tax=Temperatibacter marinus TaxID=1456591 RepID=A0AA52ECR1_9PROT|nr:EAL domain-containing protein [Temperatibacter marinus]WND02295.1 EAL domain-containing protein [Temperatibacter marinus]
MTDTGPSKISSMSLANKGMVYPSRIVNTSAVIEKLPIGVLVCSQKDDRTLDALFMNDFARDLFHTPENAKLPCPLELTWQDQDHQLLQDQIKDVFHTKLEHSIDWSISQGSIERHLSSNLFPLIDHNGSVYQVVCTLEDQTAEKLAERNLLHHAFHDSLTGLPNRVLFRSKLEEAVSDCIRSSNTLACAVLIVNIDRFQQINETFGHSAGDRFLVSMAATLRRCIRASDILARLSGDEFAILVPNCVDIQEVNMIASRIHTAMKLPYDLDGNEVFTSVSIGIATTFDSPIHPEDLIRDADYAMHAAKESGKACSKHHVRTTFDNSRSRFHLETELRRAVERDELELHYQPIINMKDNSLKGFEALARWNHKERGFVSPAEFIPIAEETSIIVDLGRWALDKVCSQIKEWDDLRGNKDSLSVNVNVSGIQFARDNIYEAVTVALDRYKTNPELLTVELTESAIINNPAQIAHTLDNLRQKGVKVALDDFGTGYSSLNYLHQFPIDCIKIDRSFIDDLEHGSQKYEILNLIAKFGHKMGLYLVAEGLETQVHVDLVHELNVTNAQGYFYSKPLNIEAATQLVKGDIPWTKS